MGKVLATICTESHGGVTHVHLESPGTNVRRIKRVDNVTRKGRQNILLHRKKEPARRRENQSQSSFYSMMSFGTFPFLSLLERKGEWRSGQHCHPRLISGLFCEKISGLVAVRNNFER